VEASGDTKDKNSCYFLCS